MLTVFAQLTKWPSGQSTGSTRVRYKFRRKQHATRRGGHVCLPFSGSSCLHPGTCFPSCPSRPCPVLDQPLHLTTDASPLIHPRPLFRQVVQVLLHMGESLGCIWIYLQRLPWTGSITLTEQNTPKGTHPVARMEKDPEFMLYEDLWKGLLLFSLEDKMTISSKYLRTLSS